MQAEINSPGAVGVPTWGEGCPEQALHPSTPPQLIWVDPADHKRKMDQKSKEVVETGRTDPSQEDEPQRGAKQP